MNLGRLSPDKLRYLRQNLHQFKKEERVRILEALEELDSRQTSKKRSSRC